MLPPLGILVALFIAFTAAQVWTDNDRAHSVVDREASALRTVVILAATFPGEPEAHLRSQIRSYIADAVAQEWPMMAHRRATLDVIPYSLAGALQLTLSLTPNSQGQQTAQREITTALENALDARRQRIIISQSEVNWIKWSCLCLVPTANPTLVTIACESADYRWDEGLVQLNLVRGGRPVPVTGGAANRNPGPATSAQCVAAQIAQAGGTRQH
jgi:hypothetical protein